jgi:hypothetical protein
MTGADLVALRRLARGEPPRVVDLFAGAGGLRVMEVRVQGGQDRTM